jgi:hypothetical protein
MYPLVVFLRAPQRGLNPIIIFFSKTTTKLLPTPNTMVSDERTPLLA